MLWWMLGGYDLVLRAVRRGRRARALQRSGSHPAAMIEITAALDLLARPRVNRASPPAVDTIISATMLLDEIATALGTPSAARGPIEAALKAIDKCRDEVTRLHHKYHPNLVELRPEKGDVLREYDDWLRHRPACLAG